MMYNVAPLSGGFMITSMLGFLISAIWVFPRSTQWGFAFSVFFVLAFIASLISMTYAPIEAEWGLDHPKKKKK